MRSKHENKEWKEEEDMSQISPLGFFYFLNLFRWFGFFSYRQKSNP